MACGCLKTIKKRFGGIPARVLCILLVMIQAAILNYYLVKYNSFLWLLWIIADVAVVAVFIIAFVVSYKHLSWPLKKNPATGGELPLGYITWGVYSIFLCCKVAIIFGLPQYIAGHLNEALIFGPNTLKAGVGLSAIIYLLLVSTHYNAAPDSPRQTYINIISHSVAIDILDTVQFLDMVFVQYTAVLLSFDMHRTIVGVACMNLLLPTLLLLMLSRTFFGRGLYPKKLRLLHTMIYLSVVNLPIMVIRFIMWHVNNTNISVFIIKNIIAVGHTLYNIYEYFIEIERLEHEKNQGNETNDAAGPPTNGGDATDYDLHGERMRTEPEPAIELENV